MGNNSKILKLIFNNNHDDATKQLAHVYCLSKLHKAPSKARFNVTAAHCSLKPLSKTVSSVF